MTRWRAFAIHLVLSLLVIGALAIGLFLLWYPPRLLGFAGAAELLTLVAGVDVVAGPLLTLVVYKAGKKSLKFDLSVIGLAQLAFLSIGLWTVWTTRPVYIVAGARDFEVVFANEVDADDLAQAESNEYRRLPLFGPILVSTREPRDQAERDDILEGELFAKSAAKRPKFFQPLEPGAAKLSAEHGQGLDGVQKFTWYIDADDLEQIGERYKHLPDARFVPAASSRGMVLFRVDPATGLPLEYVAAE